MNQTSRHTFDAAAAARLAAPFAGLNIADGIERLNALEPTQAAATVLALPWPRVIDMFDRSELQHASTIIALLPATMPRACSTASPTTAPPTSSSSSTTLPAPASPGAWAPARWLRSAP